MNQGSSLHVQCVNSPSCLVSSQLAGWRWIRPRQTQSTTLTAPPRPFTAASPIMAAAQTDALQPGALRVWAVHRHQLPLLSSHPAFRPGIQLSVVAVTHRVCFSLCLGVTFMALTTRDRFALRHSTTVITAKSPG